MKAFPQMMSKRRLTAIFLISGLIWALSGPVARAQTSSPVQQVRTERADEVRDQFHAVLQVYSPTLAQILRLDPTFLTRDDYLASYPAVAAFLKQHPEIQRNPDFYLPTVSRSNYGNYIDPRALAWRETVEWFGAFLISLTIVFGLAWLVRTAIDYRRWGRLAKVQADAHTKLLDRFTGNDDLLAYVQSPAGARFLKSAPIALDGAPKMMGSPISRILWSMQAGLVIGAAGVGLNYAAGKIDPFNAEPVFMFSVLLISIGVGFFGSAGLSYLMSKRLGLLGPTTEADEA